MEKQYRAVGFGNDKGGYKLRSQYFEVSTSPKWFTSITGQATGTINVFEGVFDFLTCCLHFSVTKLKNSSIVLNSLSFIRDALPLLKPHKVVNAFMDNDEAGKRALEQPAKKELNVQDCSNHYPNCKDFNAYLVKRSSQQ